MTQTIKVSKQGYDALTDTDPNHFIFDSSLNTFKVLAEGTTVGTITANGQALTVAHNQGRAPAFYAFCKFPDGYVALPNETDRAFTNTGERNWLAECDATNLYFVFNKGSSATYSPIVKYYIFEPTV